MTSVTRSRRQLEALERLREFGQTRAGASLATATAARRRADGALTEAESTYRALLHRQDELRGGGCAIDPGLYTVLLEASIGAQQRVQSQAAEAARAADTQRSSLGRYAESRAQLRVARAALDGFRAERQRIAEAAAHGDGHEQYLRRHSQGVRS